MPNLHGFDVWVETGGVRLKEYRAEVDGDGQEITCWIPSEAGKPFQIGCTLPRELVRSTHHKFSFYLDGRRAYLRHSIVRQREHTRRDATRRFGEERFADSGNPNSFRIFQVQFANLELTDDDSYLGTTESMDKLGEIRVVVSSVGKLVDNKNRPGASAYPGSGGSRVHEQSKKCLKHCVSLGQEAGRYVSDGSTHAVNRKKLCTFVFKYRHLDMLVADDIVERKAPTKRVSSSHTLSSQQSDRTATKRQLLAVKEGDSEDDVQVVEETDRESKIRKLKDQLAALEQPVTSRRPSKRIKMEPISTLIPGEVIDLTI